ncbi:hypothetical protein P152DRAFT_94533 [Eremomyces bilateralis CBS 781.70]|uniref:Uncharacterized protein n=1 Tax=Eremomyces bilateralis CBS 781.70 TaxID=1392243 RepID=A0A6G1FWQ1_9PEZI|nr:uncharacterized protein P152DRAFT_94533 [Eremomyces bilateralis CBS 781.70]KAF1810315.1 hypothetical protein P152DRAFT_94533 [Eremomyces bilateralis CBS 781.70]
MAHPAFHHRPTACPSPPRPPRTTCLRRRATPPRKTSAPDTSHRSGSTAPWRRSRPLPIPSARCLRDPSAPYYRRGWWVPCWCSVRPRATGSKQDHGVRCRVKFCFEHCVTPENPQI